MTAPASNRTRYRDRIVEEQDQVAAICFVGDAIHRLAKAIELFHDAEDVEAARYQAPDLKAVGGEGKAA